MPVNDVKSIYSTPFFYKLVFYRSGDLVFNGHAPSAMVVSSYLLNFWYPDYNVRLGTGTTAAYAEQKSRCAHAGLRSRSASSLSLRI